MDCSQRQYSKFVTEIFDHHDDNNFNYNEWYPNLKNKKIEFPRCSNLSLVLEDILSNKTMNNHFIDNLHSWEPDFLIAAQINDSSCFSESIKQSKWIDKDKELVYSIIGFASERCYLAKHLSTDNEENLIKSMYDCLQKSKYDEKKNIELGIVCNLNKDRKTFEVTRKKGNTKINVSFASLQVSLTELIKTFSYESLFSYLQEETSKSKISMFTIMSKTGENEYSSFIYISQAADKQIFSDTFIDAYLAALFKELVDEKKVTNNIIKEEAPIKSSNTAILKSIGGSIGRKVVWPVLNNFLENI